MTGAFSVHSTPHYERLFRKLFRSVPDLPAIHTRVREILEADPYNRGREHNIKKLEGIARGEGQYRLRLGRLRFRYDIFDQEVWLALLWNAAGGDLPPLPMPEFAKTHYR